MEGVRENDRLQGEKEREVMESALRPAQLFFVQVKWHSTAINSENVFSPCFKSLLHR